jgi:uncharacterized protein (DUF1501 family)
MKRKAFIKNTAWMAALPFMWDALSGCNPDRKQDKIFVFIQLVGGNDWLNTLIPVDNYKKTTEVRPNIFIPENKILALKNTAINGLHPSMEGIRDLFDNNLAGFIQGVGYENQNYSHFRSGDIWMTGSDADQVLHTGWMARYLETRFNNYPVGFPNSNCPDPLAIKIGDTGTYLFQGDVMDMSIVIDPSVRFDAFEVDPFTEDPESYAGAELNTIRNILLQTDKYSEVIKKAMSNSFDHSKLYPKPGDNSLADQLKLVAKMIKSGLQTSVYVVDLKGFDTHDSQVDPSNTTKGNHAELLKKLSQAITAFWEDMTRMGREKDVAGMTFSEFGRRIMSNASHGTDHGSSQAILYFGANAKSSIIGSNPVFPERVTEKDNLTMQYDFRSVYASVLKDWFKAQDPVIDKVLLRKFPKIEMFT